VLVWVREEIKSILKILVLPQIVILLFLLYCVLLSPICFFVAYEKEQQHNLYIAGRKLMSLSRVPFYTVSPKIWMRKILRKRFLWHIF